MPNGEMQLIAYGSQDIYLTGNPSITFFKFVYKKHTNFSNEHIRQDFIKLPNFNTDNKTKATCKIDRNGDLINDIYLVYDLPNIYSNPKTLFDGTKLETSNTNGEYFRWVNNLGENIIHTVEILLDGHVLDRQYGLWMNIWNELTIPKSKRHAYNMMIGNNSSLTNPSIYNGNYTGIPIDNVNTLPSINAYRLYIPLPFWFCNNPGLSIPLIALQYNQLTVQVEFNKLNDLITVGNPPVSPNAIFDSEYLNSFGNNSYSATTAKDNNNKNLSKQLITEGYSSHNLFWKFINNTQSNSSTWAQQTYLEVNFIFLDKDERRKYAQITHEYLISQVQTSHYIINNVSENIKGSVNILNLLLQHPVKELVWVLRRNDCNKRNQWNNYTTSLYSMDFHDSNNNFGDQFQKQSPVVSYANSNSYHSNKAVYYNNYLRGNGNGFNGTDKQNSCIDTYFDVNNYYNMNSDSFNYVNNIMYNAKILFNANDRISKKDSNYFNYVQPYKYHTNTPSPGVNVYSFAIYPEDNQPSGTCNMSRLNKIQLELALRWLKIKTGSECDNLEENIYEGYEVYVFATNYNILKIVGGIGGLVFAN